MNPNVIYQPHRHREVGPTHDLALGTIAKCPECGVIVKLKIAKFGAMWGPASEEELRQHVAEGNIPPEAIA